MNGNIYIPVIVIIIEFLLLLYIGKKSYVDQEINISLPQIVMALFLAIVLDGFLFYVNFPSLPAE